MAKPGTRSLSRPPPLSVPEVAGLGRGTSPDLYNKLLWLTGARLLVGTALLGATAVITVGDEGVLPRSVEGLLYLIVGGLYLASLISVFFLRARVMLRGLAHAQIVSDVAFASGLVYLTGGAESLFTVLYPLAIVNAAIGLGRRGAVLGATLSAAAFCALVAGVETGYFAGPAAFLGRAPMSPARIALTMAANLSAFLLAAGLAAYLAEQLQGARRQLALREKELEALQALHHHIVLSIGSGILTTDDQQRITYLNPAGEEITGQPLHGLRGAPLATLSNELVESLQMARSGRGEAVVNHSAGGTRIIGYAVSPLERPGAPGRPGHVIVFQDLTNLRRMEEEVRRADRLATTGKLAAGLAHEIRNPLASMTGSIELLRAAPGLRESDRRLLDILLREARRLEALVHDFLDFARPPDPVLAPVDLGTVAAETLEVFRAAASARGLSVRLDDEAPARVAADLGRLKQLLWNLLANAADATEAGGEVVVRLRRTESSGVLEVQDSGAGIAPDDRARIFDPFFTTKERGTGLGLAMVHRIVHAHGGTIEVESTPGQGATFRVSLPLAAAEAGRALPAAGAQAPGVGAPPAGARLG